MAVLFFERAGTVLLVIFCSTPVIFIFRVGFVAPKLLRYHVIIISWLLPFGSFGYRQVDFVVRVVVKSLSR